MAKSSDSYTFEYNLTAIRGRQAGRAYYVAMCPLGLVSKIFLFNEEAELDPEVRAQRRLNKGRIPELTRYILDNPENYVFSALTASIDGHVEFRPSEKAGRSVNTGTLVVSMKSKFLINDGQHRKAAIEEALNQRPNLKDETIPVVLFVDAGLRRSQQMFADLNKHAVRPTKSLGILYDQRDSLSQLARQLVDEVPIFSNLTELEKSSISNRSIKLFTLSSIYFATRELLKKRPRAPVSIKEAAGAKEFWLEVSKHMPDWQLVAKREISSAELRRDYIHAHGVALQAIARAGADLLLQRSPRWRQKLKRLSEIDWHRRNRRLWEGRATIGGRMSKATQNVLLTANAIKQELRIPLSKPEKEAERIYAQGR